MSVITRKTLKATPNELTEMFTDFLKSKYQYQPDFSVYFNTRICLPIVVNLEKESKDEFYEFYLKLQKDLISIKNKHNGYGFELGDKLLQLILDVDIDEYLFNGDKHRREEIVEDNGYAYILYSDKSLNMMPEKYVKDEIEKLENKFNEFSFHENDFSCFNTDYLKLYYFDFDREDRSLTLLYGQRRVNPLHFHILVNEKVEIRAIGYFDNKEIYKEAKMIAESIHGLFKGHPKFRLLSVYGELVLLKEDIHLVPIKIGIYKSLTALENTVISLIKNRYDYQEAGDCIDRSKKWIELTLQRAYRKRPDLRE